MYLSSVILASLPLLSTANAGISQYTKLTFFGYPDNCDSTGCYGAYTKHNCNNPNGGARNYVAGGDGSYTNPLSMAFNSGGNYKQCGLVYVAYLSKFGILDDYCDACNDNHLDIWVDSKRSDNKQKVLDCEDQLTPDNYQLVYYNVDAIGAPEFVPVDTDTLFDESTQTCTGHTY